MDPGTGPDLSAVAAQRNALRPTLSSSQAGRYFAHRDRGGDAGAASTSSMTRSSVGVDASGLAPHAAPLRKPAPSPLGVGARARASPYEQSLSLPKLAAKSASLPPAGDAPVTASSASLASRPSTRAGLPSRTGGEGAVTAARDARADARAEAPTGADRLLMRAVHGDSRSRLIISDVLRIGSALDERLPASITAGDASGADATLLDSLAALSLYASALRTMAESVGVGKSLGPGVKELVLRLASGVHTATSSLSAGVGALMMRMDDTAPPHATAGTQTPAAPAVSSRGGGATPGGSSPPNGKALPRVPSRFAVGAAPTAASLPAALPPPSSPPTARHAAAAAAAAGSSPRLPHSGLAASASVPVGGGLTLGIAAAGEGGAAVGSATERTGRKSTASAGSGGSDDSDGFAQWATPAGEDKGEGAAIASVVREPTSAAPAAPGASRGLPPLGGGTGGKSPIPKIGLAASRGKIAAASADFQAEFMAGHDTWSQSWRDEAAATVKTHAMALAAAGIHIAPKAGTARGGGAAVGGGGGHGGSPLAASSGGV